MLTIRKYKSSDCGHLAELFYQTVHAVNAKDYSEEQLNAELEKGYADMMAGRTKPASKAFADIRRDYQD